MKYKDYKVEILKYIIPYFRNNTDIKNILIAIGMRFNQLQDIIVELLDSLTISKAQGFLLDNIGREVGTTRDDVDYTSYFCLNVAHINVSKRFYFLASQLNPDVTISLEDTEFIQKIMAVIAGNMSSGTRNENLNIIKLITNADNVIIDKVGTCELDIYITGENIIYTNNTLSYIERILADGTFLNGVHINE